MMLGRGSRARVDSLAGHTSLMCPLALRIKVWKLLNCWFIPNLCANEQGGGVL